MGYNGNNRGRSRRRSEHRGAYKSGEHIMGSIFAGLLGLGAMAVNEAAKAAQKSPLPQADKNKDTTLGFGCFVIASVVLIPLGVFSLAIWGFPIVGQIIAFVIIACLYGLFEEDALSISKQKFYVKILFWLAITILALFCSYKLMCWSFECRHFFISDIHDVLMLTIGAIVPLFSCIVGYFVGIHKLKKKEKQK